MLMMFSPHTTMMVQKTLETKPIGRMSPAPTPAIAATSSQFNTFGQLCIRLRARMRDRRKVRATRRMWSVLFRENQKPLPRGPPASTSFLRLVPAASKKNMELGTWM
jgi:hypothetical protein